ALGQWNFGTLAQRFSFELWSTLRYRTLPDVIGHGAVAVAALGLLIAAHRRVAPALACVALFLSAPLIFTNLHVVHNYYAYANGIFLIAAIGSAIVGGLESGGWRKQCAVAVLACAIGASVWLYRSAYVPVQRTNDAWWLETAKVLQESTAADDV